MTTEKQIRELIVSLASAETSKAIAASQADPVDRTKRKGWERLKVYFDTAAPNGFPGVLNFPRPDPDTDWCGIFALWAIKAARAPGAKRGAPGVGTWIATKGISSVPGMVPTSSPQKGDVAAVAEGTQHMDLVFSVSADGQSIQTIDGNDAGGTVTGPSTSKPRTNFTAGFFTAFLSPVGTWDVTIQNVTGNDFTWIYTFNSDGTAKWSGIQQPPDTGVGKWDNSGDFLQISWDLVPSEVTGSVEQWDTPLTFSGQQGGLVGQGRIITASKR
jgi:hypothetical protein